MELFGNSHKAAQEAIDAFWLRRVERDTETVQRYIWTKLTEEAKVGLLRAHNQQKLERFRGHLAFHPDGVGIKINDVYTIKSQPGGSMLIKPPGSEKWHTEQEFLSLTPVSLQGHQWHLLIKVPLDNPLLAALSAPEIINNLNKQPEQQRLRRQHDHSTDGFSTRFYCDHD